MNAGFHLQADEHVILMTRRHWIDLAPVFVVASVLLGAVLYFAATYSSYQAELPLKGSTMALMLLVVLLFAFGIVIVGIMVYKENYLVLTNLHLIQVEQSGLFNRSVSQLSLSRLQDVSGKRVGVLATLLDFGNMEVQSAGEHEKFIFRNAPSPQALAERCLDAHEDFMRATGGRPIEQDNL